MPVTNTDAVLWYNVGEFGKAGYAVPNWSNDVGSLNPQILDWTVPRRPQSVPHHAPRGRRPADSAVDQHGQADSQAVHPGRRTSWPAGPCRRARTTWK